MHWVPLTKACCARLGLAMAFVSFFACHSTQSLRSLALERALSQDTAAFPWVSVPAEEMIAQLGNGRQLSADPLHLRLQSWLDRLDHSLREKDPVAMKGVPQPRILLLDEAAPQAFVGSVAVCLNRASRMQTAEGASEDYLGLDRELRGLYSASGPRNCVPLPYRGAALQQFLNWYLQPFPACTARVLPRTVDFSAGCMESAVNGLNMPAQTRDIVLRLNGPWLVMSLGLMQSLTEYEAASVVFHEAAHFYQGHLWQAQSLTELDTERLYWLRAQTYGRRNPVAGFSEARYHSLLFILARNMLQEWMRKEGNRSACKELAQPLLTGSGLGHFPWEAPSADGEMAYRAYEEKIETCLAGLPRDAAMVERMSEQIRRAVPWSSRALTQVPEFASVQELWTWLNQKLPRLLREPDVRVAAYGADSSPSSRDEEAGELTSTWLTVFDIDLQHSVTAARKQLQLATRFPASTSYPGAYTYEHCARASQARARLHDEQNKLRATRPHPHKTAR